MVAYFTLQATRHWKRYAKNEIETYNADAQMLNIVK